MDIIASELHKPIKKPKQYRKIFVNNINDIWSLDLVEMQEFENVNNGYRYILTCIDLYSRYAWAIPLKNKTGKDTANAIQSIITSSGKQPKKLWTDEGKEFLNKDVEKLRKKYDIDIYNTFGVAKAAVIERFNRTLKTIMFKKFTINGTRVWYNMIDELLKLYNNKIHRSLEKKSPSNVYNNDVNIPGNSKDDRNKTKVKFKIGDRVRISYKREVFQKGYLPNWSNQIYTIASIIKSKPTTYTIENERHEIIKGSFYIEELQKTSQKENIYLVEKILQTKTVKGKKMCLIKWLNYDDKFNSWEPAENVEHDLKNIGKL